MTVVRGLGDTWHSSLSAISAGGKQETLGLTALPGSVSGLNRPFGRPSDVDFGAPFRSGLDPEQTGLRHIRVRVRSRGSSSYSVWSRSRSGHAGAQAVDPIEESQGHSNKPGTKVSLEPEAEPGVETEAETEVEAEGEADAKAEGDIKTEYVAWPGPHAHIYTHTLDDRSIVRGEMGSHRGRASPRGRRGETAPLLPPGTYDAAAIQAWGKSRPGRAFTSPIQASPEQATLSASSLPVLPSVAVCSSVGGRQNDNDALGQPPPQQAGGDGKDLEEGHGLSGLVPHATTDSRSHAPDHTGAEKSSTLLNQSEGREPNAKQAPSDGIQHQEHDEQAPAGQSTKEDNPNTDAGAHRNEDREAEEDPGQILDISEEEEEALGQAGLTGLVHEPPDTPIGVQGALGFDTKDFEAESDGSAPSTPGAGAGAAGIVNTDRKQNRVGFQFTPIQSAHLAASASSAASALATSSLLKGGTSTCRRRTAGDHSTDLQMGLPANEI